jgi:hypothetical protein
MTHMADKPKRTIIIIHGADAEELLANGDALDYPYVYEISRVDGLAVAVDAQDYRAWRAARTQSISLAAPFLNQRRNPVATEKPKQSKWYMATVEAVIYLNSLGMCWLIVHLFDVSWDRAILATILWLVCVTRVHQED